MARRNEYKQEPLSEEQIEAMQEAVEEKAEATRNFFKTLVSPDRFSSKTFVEFVPFLAFVAFLAMVYIANRHHAEKTVRQIDRLSREVKEMTWDYKSLSAELMKRTTQTEVAKKAEPLGLEERKSPPRKILLKEEIQ